MVRDTKGILRTERQEEVGADRKVRRERSSEGIF